MAERPTLDNLREKRRLIEGLEYVQEGLDAAREVANDMVCMTHGRESAEWAERREKMDRALEFLLGHHPDKPARVLPSGTPPPELEASDG